MHKDLFCARGKGKFPVFFTNNTNDKKHNGGKDI
jgi:hypothetical protein